MMLIFLWPLMFCWAQARWFRAPFDPVAAGLHFNAQQFHFCAEPTIGRAYAGNVSEAAE